MRWYQIHAVKSEINDFYWELKKFFFLVKMINEVHFIVCETLMEESLHVSFNYWYESDGFNSISVAIDETVS